MENISLII